MFGFFIMLRSISTPIISTLARKFQTSHWLKLTGMLKIWNLRASVEIIWVGVTFFLLRVTFFFTSGNRPSHVYLICGSGEVCVWRYHGAFFSQYKLYFFSQKRQCDGLHWRFWEKIIALTFLREKVGFVVWKECTHNRCAAWEWKYACTPG